MRQISSKMLDCILDGFWLYVRPILDVFQKTASENNKGDFVKMSVLPPRGAHFEGFGPPKSIQKSLKNRAKNEVLF